MTTYAADQAAGASGSNLTARNDLLGNAWTMHTSTNTTSLVISDAARIRSANVNAQAVAYNGGTPGSADYDVYGTLRAKSVGASLTAWLVARINTAAKTYYYAEWENANTRWRIRRYLAGTDGLVANGSNVGALTLDADYKLRLRVNGTTISLDVWGPGDTGYVTRVTATNSDISAAGKAGIGANNGTNTTGIHITDFAVTGVGETPLFNPAPTVTSVSASSGGTAGSDSVTITGTGFLTGATVTFGGSAATNVVRVSGTSITCDTPAHAAGAVDVVVTNTDAQTGTGTSAYTYTAGASPPNLTSVSPTAGTTAGGTAVTLTGTDFVIGATVTFDGTPATSVVFVNSISITCVTPAHAAGAVDIVVTNPDTQTDTLASGFDYAGSTTYGYDQFPDAAGTAITSRPSGSGHLWLLHPTLGQLSPIVSSQNRARSNNNVSNALALLQATPASADYDVYGTFRAKSIVGGAWLAARWDEAVKTGYYADWDNANTRWRIRRYLAATDGSVVNGSSVGALTLDSDYKLKLRVNGTTITLYVWGPGDVAYVSRATATNSEITAAGLGGIMVNTGTDSTGIHWDDFALTAVGDSPAYTSAAPVISNEDEDQVLDTSFRALFDTDKAVKVQVVYGGISRPSDTGGTGYPSATTQTAYESSPHAVAVTGLSAATNYYWRAKVTDSANQTVVSGEQGPVTTDAAGASNKTVVGTLRLTARFNEIGIYLPFTGDANSNANLGHEDHMLIVSGTAAAGATSIPVLALPIRVRSGTILALRGQQVVVASDAAVGATSVAVAALSVGVQSGDGMYISPIRFKRTVDTNWRMALPGWLFNRGGAQGGFYSTAWNLDNDTAYDFSLDVHDADGIVGTNPVTGSATTRAEDIVTHAALVAAATRYVDKAAGNDSTGTGLVGAPWASIGKAIAAAPTAAIVLVKAGRYGVSGHIRTAALGAITLVAETPACDTDGAIINAGSHVLVEWGLTNTPLVTGPSNATYAEVVVNPWTLVDPVGPHTGTHYTGWYSYTPGALMPAGQSVSTMQLCYAATRLGLTKRLEIWKLPGITSFHRAVEFAEENNAAWNTGFWLDEANQVIYARLPGGVDPNTVYINISSTLAWELRAPDCRTSGFEFRGFRQPVWHTNGASRAVFDRNLVQSALYGTRLEGAKPATYNVDTVVQDNHFRDDRLWNDNQSGTDKIISWKGIKDTCTDAWSSFGTTLNQNETCGIFLSGGAIGLVIRRNTFDGTFNGVTCQSPGYSYDHSRDTTVVDNTFMHHSDDAIEPDFYSLGWVAYRNRVERCGTFCSIAPLIGLFVVAENEAWKIGGSGAGRRKYDGNPGVGPTYFKYGADSVPQGRVWILYNTLWTDDPAGNGGDGSAASVHLTGGWTDGLAPNAGGNQVEEAKVLRGNLIRGTRTGALFNEWTPGANKEDYNVIWTPKSPATGVSGGLRWKNNKYGTAAEMAAYRAYSGQGPHTNKLGGSDYGPSADYATLDAQLTDATAGDLTLAASSLYRSAGIPVPNVRDLPGTNYDGTNPDLGATEVFAADVTPPIISAEAATNLTATGATITWTTDEPADSQVEYGTTTGYGTLTSIDNAPVTAHSLTLAGLAASTLYHYRVKSRDLSGNLRTGTDHTFTSAAGADTTAPVISNVAVSGLTPTGAAITWDTDEPADSQIEYGTTTSYGTTTALDVALVTTHSVGLAGLTPGTTYHYRIRTRDAALNTALLVDRTFATAAATDTTAPVISAIAVSAITLNGAVIAWTTDEAADSQVQWGTDGTSYPTLSALDTTPRTAHSLALTGLPESTPIHFRVLSRDAAGNLAVSTNQTFNTTGAQDTTAPVLSNIAVVGIGAHEATITWDTDEAADSAVEYGTDSSYGLTATGGLVYPAHTVGLAGLPAETTIHYRVLSRDASGNLAIGTDRTFTTLTVPRGAGHGARLGQRARAGIR